jgi:type VI secretion system protein VasD
MISRINLILWAKGLSLLLLVSLVACSPTATFNINSANYLNPDINGEASPVIVTIYQLKTGYNFAQADYQSLTNNAAQVLGDAIIDKSSFPIRRGNGLSVEQKVYPNTNYIGIVAAYRDPNSVSWHKVVKLKKTGGSITVTLNLESEGLTVKQS